MLQCVVNRYACKGECNCLLYSFNELEEDRGDLSLVSTCHWALAKAAMLSSEGKHTSDLDTQSISLLLLLQVFLRKSTTHDLIYDIRPLTPSLTVSPLLSRAS